MTRERVWVTAGALVVAAAGTMTATLLVRRRSGRQTPSRWHSVTVVVPRAQIGELPAPLGDLGESVEIRMREAPGGRGTELSARWDGLGGRRKRPSDSNIRRALRESRQLLEIGEVVSADRPTTTKRTLRSRPLELVTSHGRAGGRL